MTRISEEEPQTLGCSPEAGAMSESSGVTMPLSMMRSFSSWRFLMRTPAADSYPKTLVRP